MSARWDGVDPHTTVELLLKRGAHVNAYEINHWTALTECGNYGLLQLAELLFAHRAQVDGMPGKDDPSSDSNPDLKGKFYETPPIVCGT